MCDIVCPSQSLSLDVGPPTKLAPSSSLSGRVGTGGRVCVAAPAPPVPAPVCSSGSWTRRLQDSCVRWDSNWIESENTILTTAGVQPYIHSWCSNRLWVKMWNREHRCKYLQFSRTEEFEEHLPAWKRMILEHRSFHHWFRKKSIWNCLPAKHSDQGGKGERKKCSKFMTRSISREANILDQ